MASVESSMEAHLHLYEIFLTAAKPMALQAAILVNIPDIIGSENQLSVEEIGSHICASTNKPVHIDCLSRIMTLLASIGVFTEETTADNRGIPQLKYGPTGLSQLLANSEPQESCAPTLLFLNQNIVRQGYQYLHDTFIDGCQPFTGMSIFEYNSKNPEANRILNEAMTAQTSSVMASVLKAHDAVIDGMSIFEYNRCHGK
ncbi:caffeic acid 3-O-methyltransferase 1-like [Cryptomeria japonica]|uniref:caffeic acid 3-O-methyltransferase 1-like n=1 Tax=Cryptomeria japonica TaxID=3369 RepID=UPI0027DA6900|nr:caffeic acid 3-O-methyltransferase 1-like [Cryptomeria japonica]